MWGGDPWVAHVGLWIDPSFIDCLKRSKVGVEAMNYGSTTPTRIETVRQATIAVLERVAEKAKAYQLPAPPATLEDYRRKLVANNYQVLVVGEAKRGKSSFVNALIGRPILPTDVDVATSQVFRIRPRFQRTNHSGRVGFHSDATRHHSPHPLHSNQD